MVEAKPYSRTRLPLMRDLKERTKKEVKLFERKSRIMTWIKQKKTEAKKELTEKQKEFQNAVAIHRANIATLVGEYNLVQMNKTGSKFFQWIPNAGMNRQQAREFRRQRIKRERIATNRVGSIHLAK